MSFLTKLQINSVRNINKIELNKKINGDVDILKIVDKGKVKLKEIGAPDLHLHDHKHSHHSVSYTHLTLPTKRIV